MSNLNEQHNSDVEPKAGSATPGSSSGPDAGGLGNSPLLKALQDARSDDPTADFKRRLEETRLPEGMREQIQSELPAPEDRERLLRELMEKGGLSSEQFFQSLGLEAAKLP